MKTKILRVILEQSTRNTELKLVHSTNKKIAIRHMGCKRCEMKDWRF